MNIKVLLAVVLIFALFGLGGMLLGSQEQKVVNAPDSGVATSTVTVVATTTPSTATTTESGSGQASLDLLLNQSGSTLGLTLTPTEVVDDSRCPIDVNCIQAGTVHMRASLSTTAATQAQLFEIGKPIVFGRYTVTLSDVGPARHAVEKAVLLKYHFIFSVVRK